MDRSSPQKVISIVVLALVAGVHGAAVTLQIGGISQTWLGFALAQGIALPVWGALGDRLGCKRVMFYSLALSVLVALLGYAPLFNVAINQGFVFAVFSGLVVASLPLALGYAFSLDSRRPPVQVAGFVLCGFFAGSALMSLLRLFAFSMPYREYLAVTATFVFLLSFLAFACVALLLPGIRPTTVEFIGMNATQKLWHGFAESSRAGFAGSWKVLLALTGLASGAVINVVPALVYAANPAAGPAAPMRWLFFALACAAAASFVAPSFRKQPESAEKILVLGSIASLLLASVIVIGNGTGSLAGVFAALSLGGIATGIILTLGIITFAEVARRRSAGAEMGAVVTIWLVPFLGGTFLARVTFAETPQVPVFVALAASAVCFLLAWSAVRRPMA